MDLSQLPKKILSKNKTISNFTTTNITTISDINVIAYQMYHEQSGAHLLYLHAEDNENLFSIAFKTPPSDDTGLPHILEHTVLCGSKKYPVKDPFVELLKSSLATFLNAMTYPDKTVYPCASMNETDFHNLVNVYCDAVFFPMITEKHFKQEGHHLNFKVPGDIKSPLFTKGVVFNEMKGVYSDLNGIISKEEAKSLFKKNSYGRDSGGDPLVIPTLKYNKFVDFYKKYYHPSNAYFFIYGNFDITKTLKIIDNNYLSKFKKININAEIEQEPIRTSPVKKTIRYPFSKTEKKQKKSAVTANFLSNPITNTMDHLAMTVIEYYLLGNASSPLRKALVDSRLGEALTSSGYADFQRDTYFSAGLKGIEKKDANKVFGLIIETCKKVAKKGFEKKKVETVFRKLELHSKEIQSSYPLSLMDRVYSYWLYGADPLCLLNLNSHLEKLKNRFEKDPEYFGKILEKYIINNPHYSVLTFIPDKDYFEKIQLKSITKMEKLKSKMSEQELKDIAKEAKELDKMQLTPNSPKNLATLPKLSLSSVSKQSQIIDKEIYHVENRPFIVSNIFSNDINYVNLAFDLRGIDQDLINYLSIFKFALLKMGAGKYNYAEMAEREDAASGGIGAGLLADGKFDDPNDCFPYLAISSKALNSTFEDLLDVISDRLLLCDFTDTRRLEDVILQVRTSLRGNILGAGSSHAVLYAGRNINYNHYLSEKFRGFSHIRFITKLAKQFKTEKDKLIENLRRIQKFIINKNRVYISFVGAPPQEKILGKWYSKMIQASTDGAIDNSYNELKFVKSCSGIAIPSNVAFNAAVLPPLKATDNNAAALLFLSQNLSYNYLWEEIRVKKGAYGARANYSLLGGNFSFSTFRDPCIQESIKTFNNTFNYIREKMDLSRDAIDKVIVGSIKRLDRPNRPGESVGISLTRYLRNIKDEYRQKLRSDLLSLTKKNILDTAFNVLEPAYQKASICTISGKDRLIEVNNSTDFLNFEIEDL